MAITASLIVSPTVVLESQMVSVTLVLTQPAGGGAVQLLRIDPYLLNTAASSNACPGLPGFAGPTIGQSTMLTSVAAANTPYSFNWVTQIGLGSAPLNPIYPSTPLYQQYTIGAVAYFSDGTTASASSSFFVFPNFKDSTLAMTPMPGKGDLRFDSNLESQFAPPAISALPMVGLVTPGKSA